MNDAHFHLVVNHLPIVFPMVGVIIMIGGFLFRSEVIKRTSFAIFILGAMVTVPAFMSGEGAEEVVEHMAGMSHDLIHEHEEKAETFALLSYLLGAISLIGIWANWKRKKIASILAILTLVMSGAVLYFAKQTGTSGGEIRHTEIRSGAINETPILDRDDD
jgi:uncharacterized membrane protein